MEFLSFFRFIPKELAYLIFLYLDDKSLFELNSLNYPIFRILFNDKYEYKLEIEIYNPVEIHIMELDYKDAMNIYNVMETDKFFD